MNRNEPTRIFTILLAACMITSGGVTVADDLLWIQKEELREVSGRIRDELTLCTVSDEDPAKQKYLEWLDLQADELLNAKGGYWSEYDSVNHPAISHHAKAFGYVTLLAQAYFTPGSRHHQQQPVWQAVEDGLRHFLQFAHPGMPERKPHNWWAWDIGIPMHLLDALILGQDQMSRDLYEREVATVAHLLKVEEEVGRDASWTRSGEPAGGRTDMNRLWHAQLRMRLGVLLENPAMAGKWGEKAFGEMVAPGAGAWQSDRSYKFHGQCPMWAYGRHFIHDYAKLLHRYRGTSFGPTDKQLDHYAGMLLGYVNGFLYRGRIDPAMIGREISRGEKIHYNSTVPFALAVMSQTDHPRAGMFARLYARESQYVEAGHPAHLRLQAYGQAIARQALPAEPVNDIFAYPDSDFLQVTRPGWALGIKMHSKRNCGYESINRENLSGWFLSHGSMFHYIEGTEWDAAWSTLDWIRLPGTTVARDMTGRNESCLVGVLRCSSRLAVACMELKHGPFQARKSWVVDGDVIVCLGSAIRGPGIVETTVANQPVGDQSDIWIDGERVEDRALDRHMTVRWIWFDGVGYVFSEAQEVRVLRETRPSEWSSIRDQAMHGVGEVITQEFVTVVIEHDETHRDYAYVMMLAADRNVVDAMASQVAERLALTRSDTLHAVRAGTILEVQVNWEHVRQEEDGKPLPLIRLAQGDQVWTFDRPSCGETDHE